MKRTYFHGNMFDEQLPKQWALGAAFRLNAYFLPPGLMPKVEYLSVLILPTKYKTSFTQWAWPCEASQGKSGSLEPSMVAARTEQGWTIPGSNPFTSCPGGLRRGWTCSRGPYSKRTEGWDVKGTGLEKKEKNWLSLELRAICHSTHCQSRFVWQASETQHLPTKTHLYWERKN